MIFIFLILIGIFIERMGYREGCVLWNFIIIEDICWWLLIIVLWVLNIGYLRGKEIKYNIFVIK